MIQLIRVYRDGRVIHAEAYDIHEYPPQPEPYLRCRCIPSPLWNQRELALKREFSYDDVTVTSIYPTPK